MEQLKDYRLEQATFLHTLTTEFQNIAQMVIDALPVLTRYTTIPKSMSEKDWDRTVSALSDYYQIIRYYYNIALLTESGVIDIELLYIFYHDEMSTFVIIEVISYLIYWCGTDLDTAAHYHPDDLLVISGTLVKLLEKLTSVHKEKGFDVSSDEETISGFKEKMKNAKSNRKEFDNSSKYYLDKTVAIRKKENGV